MCVAIDNAGRVLSRPIQPAARAAWTSTTVSQGANRAGVVRLDRAVRGPGIRRCGLEESHRWCRRMAYGEDRRKWTLGSISCPSAELCVAVDFGGNAYTSSDPASAHGTWAVAPIDGLPCAAGYPCISEQLYAHDDRGTRLIDSAGPGSGNSIGGVRLGGDSLSLTWRHDGAARMLELR